MAISLTSIITPTTPGQLLLWIFIISSIAAVVRGAEDDEEDLSSTNIILFLFFGLGVGILAMQILSIFGEKLPYTVVIFILGAILSLADNKNGGKFGESVSEWVNINADLMLFIFLPPLVFGEAMYLNWYYFKGGLMQSFLLAGPGVLIGAALMGMFTKVLLPYNWAWNLCMLFGSILAATDTVAMVALLKSVGASPKLTILIVGESLLNDGSAMILFTIFYNSVNGKLYTAGSIVSFVLTTVLGSLLLGAVIGMLTLRWLRSANRPLVETDVTVQIAVTICCAYLTFFVAQNTLELSGILACVAAGSVLAWLAPPIILDHESMHNVWGMLEWGLNTVIFLLAGLIGGHRILTKVDAMDWFYCIVLYIALNVVRGITIAILFPLVSSIGHKCTVKEASFMSWAGLRGALGMALAVIVENNCPADIHDQTSRIFFYVGGIASLTLLVNATTAKSLLIGLGLVSADSPEKALVTSQIKKKLQKKTDRFITDMTKEFELTPTDIEEVRMSCTLLHDLDMQSLFRDTEYMPPDMLTEVLANATNPMTSTTGELEGSSPYRFGSQSWRKSFLHSVEQGSNREESRSRSILQRKASNEFEASMNNLQQVHRSISRRLRSQDLGKSQRSLLLSKHLSASLIQAKHISRLLSLHSRAGGNSTVLLPELVQYVRAIFLEIVRVKYWHFIEIGKLPRLSFSAQFLIYTIDVGLDRAKEDLGLDEGTHDWKALEEEISFIPYGIRFLKVYIEWTPGWMGKIASRTLAFLEARNEKRVCYMLSAFIEAHEHAQKKIHSFLGLDDVEDVEEAEEHRGQEEHKSTPTARHGNHSTSQREAAPEEMVIIEESKRAVSA